MSHSWSSRARSLLSRRLHVWLRLKVMAGVVVVTLLALAAFDVGVVTTMRRYLLTQTDNNLHLALTVTEPRLNSLVSEGFPSRSSPPSPLSSPPGYQRPTSKLPGFLGDFQIAFVPWRGPVVTLEIGETGVGGTQWAYMPPGTARSVARPGPHTVPVGGVPFRFRSARVTGGWLVAGTSLDQVTETTGRVEASSPLVRSRWCWSSVSASSSWCAVACARSRRWPGRRTGSPAAT